MHEGDLTQQIELMICPERKPRASAALIRSKATEELELLYVEMFSRMKAVHLAKETEWKAALGEAER